MSSNPQGMGPGSHGPDFARPPSGQTPASGPYSGPQPPRRPTPQRPPKNRLPAVITAAVIGVVALIVVAATIYANRQDAQVVAESQQSSAAPRPTAVPSSSDDTIRFSSAEGSGQLTMESHEWTSDGPIPPEYGEYLQIELEISATDGAISYGPEYFQAFDASGDLFQTTEAGIGDQALPSGVVHAGDTVTGEIAFDIPRGAVTLLMSNSMMESVTALRIND